MKFELTDREVKAFNDFKQNHKCKLKKRSDKVFYTISFTSNGIGDNVKVKCSCGKKIDITDYDSW